MRKEKYTPEEVDGLMRVIKENNIKRIDDVSLELMLKLSESTGKPYKEVHKMLISILIPPILRKTVKTFFLESDIYPKRKSGVGEWTVCCGPNEVVDGIYIQYLILDDTEEGLKKSFPKRKVKRLVRETKKILGKNRIKVKNIILDLQEFNPLGGGFGGRAFMNKERDTAVITIEDNVEEGTYEEHVLWHEILHIKDIYERRFPSIHPFATTDYEWLNELWHFSIEGRLEKLGVWQRGKEKVKEELMVNFNVSKESADLICERLWGKLVTFEELRKIAKEIKIKKRKPKAL